MLLHGSGDLRGWGQPAMPDPTLLYVRGFDPATQRSRYEVNERFGRTNPAFGGFRSPVTLTAMLRFDVGPTRERQLLTQQLDRGRRRGAASDRVPEPLLRAMYGNGGLQNPMATILRQQDSLKLTGPQADSVATLNRWYTVRLDSIWAPVTKWLAELPEGYDRDVAYDRWLAAREATVDLLAGLAPHVKGLLTEEQRRRLPPLVASHLEPRYLAAVRSGTMTFAGAGMGMMGGPVPAMGGGERVTMQVGGGGGGGGSVIIRTP
jgi:hypothetical protein